eukprot:Skav215691  [mRNA]  locus=scaffold278:447564:449745:- [translate_table: standard]
MAAWKLVPVLGLIAAASTCLDDGIPARQRKNLTDGKGENYPVGVFVPNWASAHLVSDIVIILVEELLGFHVLRVTGPDAASQMYAVAGCTSPDNHRDRGCNDAASRETRFHITMEVWKTHAYDALRDLDQLYPGAMPVELGSIGYEGSSGVYVLSQILQNALEAEGLALDHYRAYDASWHEPHMYFDNFTAIDVSDLSACEDTPLDDPTKMEQYANVTGDWQGVEKVSGIFRGKCFQKSFWLPPACRVSTAKCLVFLTAGGYELEFMMQRATVFHMPVIIADVKKWTIFEQMPSKVSTLLYLWEPNPMFLGLKPKLVGFPRHDRTSWERGLKMSAAKDVSLDAWEQALARLAIVN